MIKYTMIATALLACTTACNNAQNDNSNTTKPTTASKKCFLLVTNQVDSTTVSLTQEGDSITGTMHYNPYARDGAIGTLKGTKTGSTITAIYNYVIEGSSQKEEKIMELSGTSLLIKTGALNDVNGVMTIANKATATVKDTMHMVACGK